MKQGVVGGLCCLILVLALPADAIEPLVDVRSIDGSGNNLRHPKWGSAGDELLRLTEAAYEDGRSQPSGSVRPGAREVSNACAAQTRSTFNDGGRSHFLWAWGQFVDHDISLTGPAEPTEHFDIPVPAGDRQFDPDSTGTAVIPFVRSAHKKGKVRQQVNEITAWIDASQVYGSDEKRAKALRRRGGKGDRLKTSLGRMLPYNVAGFDNAPFEGDPSMFLAGDLRANENIALTALHVLFVREHNRIVRMLRHAGGLNAEKRHQLARALVGAELQAITYKEFLPALLGDGALAPYESYRPGTNPGISNLFSTACYRFGHSMLPGRLLRLARSGEPISRGHLRLRDAFFSPGELNQTGIEPVLRGLAAVRAQEVDTLVIDDVRNFLFGRPGQGGFDLASFNIQRGRDHGLPSYNQARLELGLAPVTSFSEITSDEEAAARLRGIYPSVRTIDPWIGALTEDHVSGAMVGELAFHVIRDQFERLRDGDRFWYQNALPEELVGWVEQHTLARILRLNTRIGNELRDDLFRMP